ncbi:MAG: heme ABC exporter ATP-binding protein CcmA [Legionellales bacterium]|nr:heme ABC exporter ATP-binding protein CcmA [Legionellales bacterium]
MKLIVSQLTVERDARQLFDRINITLNAGEGLLITGANGSGKTSLLRSLIGLIKPMHGCASLDQQPLPECRERWIYLSHGLGLKQSLTVAENLKLFHQLYPCGMSIDTALTQVDLSGYASVLVQQLSAGQQRRVMLARLWMQQADLWVLDEPLTALDRNGICTMQQLLQQHLAVGKLVVITSHQPVHFAEFTLQALQL